MINLKVIRDSFRENATLGKLYVNDVFLCHTLEDKTRPRGEKVPGETCIPEGVYKVTLVMSPKRGILVPLLHNVPMFTAIEIHIGNTPKDTLGCILVGMEREETIDRINGSSIAFGKLMEILRKDPEIQISITDFPHEM